jgi:hypothetical protein
MVNDSIVPPLDALSAPHRVNVPRDSKRAQLDPQIIDLTLTLQRQLTTISLIGELES